MKKTPKAPAPAAAEAAAAPLSAVPRHTPRRERHHPAVPRGAKPTMNAGRGGERGKGGGPAHTAPLCRFLKGHCYAGDSLSFPIPPCEWMRRDICRDTLPFACKSEVGDARQPTGDTGPATPQPPQVHGHPPIPLHPPGHRATRSAKKHRFTAKTSTPPPGGRRKRSARRGGGEGCCSPRCSAENTASTVPGAGMLPKPPSAGDGEGWEVENPLEVSRQAPVPSSPELGGGTYRRPAVPAVLPPPPAPGGLPAAE